MFSTIHVATLQEIQQRRAEDASLVAISTITGKPKRLRLRNGCAFCKTRKKKCDEQKPACGLCVAKNMRCYYLTQPHDWDELRGSDSARASLLLAEMDMLPPAPTPVRVTPTASPGYLPKQIVADFFSLLADRTPLPKFQAVSKVQDVPKIQAVPKVQAVPKIQEVDEYGAPTEQAVACSALPVLIEPSSPFSLVLDSELLLFFDHFLHDVVPTLSISPKTHQNHFANTCVTVATQDEGFVWLLAAWGALSLGGPTDAAFGRYLRRAHAYTEKKLAQAALSDTEWFNLMFFYLQAAGIDICAGDTSSWYEQFKRCGDMFRRFGSTKSFLRKFNNSMEARWFVLNLQYHDVTSLVLPKYGTLLDMSEYSVVFEDDNDFSWGIDPLQGCMHPVFLLLGEIMNTNAELHRQRVETEEALNSMAMLEELSHKRMQRCIYASSRAADLMAKLHACEPKSNQQCFLPPEDLEDHLTLFEAFRNTCKLYILVYIQGMQIKAPEVQVILMDLFKLVDLLIASKLRVAISMVLLMCGLCSCYKADRDEISRKFDKLLQHYKVLNVGRVKHLVEQSWRVNPEGNMNIDWVDLCERIGWKLSMS